VKRLSIGTLTSILTVCSFIVAGGPVAPASAANGLRVPAAGQASEFPDKVCPDVVPAPANEKDTAGNLITPRPLEGKRSVPVILVHGWNGAPDTFTHPIDLFADGGDGGAGTRIPFSITGQLQKIPGLAVYDFDYSQYSDRWVTDDHIGPKLASAIKCLTDHYRTKAEIIAHSMGGLATRYALAQDLSGTPIRDRVSAVATLGTPNTGSVVATVASIALNVAARQKGLVGDAAIAVWLFTQVCGREITKSTTNLPPPCSNVPRWAAGFDSDAARAMHVGSPELAALPQWPPNVPVTAIQGSIMLRGLSLFGAGDISGGFNDGDFIVTNSSASAFSTTVKDETCGYSLAAVFDKSDTRIDATRADAGTLRNGAASLGVLTGPTNPCFHGNLLRTINGTNVAVGAIKAAAENTLLPSEPQVPPPPASSPPPKAAAQSGGNQGAQTLCSVYLRMTSSEKNAVIVRVAGDNNWKDRSAAMIKIGQYSADLFCNTHSGDARVGRIDTG
jgi:triacylglycerol lipase